MWNRSLGGEGCALASPGGGCGYSADGFQAEFREEQPSWAVLLAVAFTGVVLLILMPEVASVVQALTALAREGSIGSFYLNPVLKTIGVAYVTSFGVQVSQEAGRRPFLR